MISDPEKFLRERTKYLVKTENITVASVVTTQIATKKAAQIWTYKSFKATTAATGEDATEGTGLLKRDLDLEQGNEEGNEQGVEQKDDKKDK